VTSLREVGIEPTVYDVAIVGAGPSGSACAYWLAEAGWSVCLVEKKTFPREKTCGDGLTRGRSNQLREMGLEDSVAAKGHRFNGLRAFGFGATLEMNWPNTRFFQATLHDHPIQSRRPSRSTRREPRATLLNGSKRSRS